MTSLNGRRVEIRVNGKPVNITGQLIDGSCLPDLPGEVHRIASQAAQETYYRVWSEEAKARGLKTTRNPGGVK